MERMPATRNLLMEKAVQEAKATAAVAAASSSTGDAPRGSNEVEVIGKAPIGATKRGNPFVKAVPKWTSANKGRVEGEEPSWAEAEDFTDVVGGPAEEPEVVAVVVSNERYDSSLEKGDDVEAWSLGALPGYYWEVGRRFNGTKVYKQEPPAEADAPNHHQFLLFREESGWYIASKIISETVPVEDVAVAWCGMSLLPPHGSKVHVPYWKSNKTVKSGVAIMTMKQYIESQLVVMDDKLDETEAALKEATERAEAAEAEVEDLHSMQEQRRQDNNAKGGGGGNVNKLAQVSVALWKNNIQHAKDLALKFYNSNPTLKQAVDSKWNHNDRS